MDQRLARRSALFVTMPQGKSRASMLVQQLEHAWKELRVDGTGCFA